MTEPTPALWPTAHQAILAGQSPAIPGPPSTKCEHGRPNAVRCSICAGDFTPCGDTGPGSDFGYPLLVPCVLPLNHRGDQCADNLRGYGVLWAEPCGDCTSCGRGRQCFEPVAPLVRCTTCGGTGRVVDCDQGDLTVDCPTCSTPAQPSGGDPS